MEYTLPLVTASLVLPLVVRAVAAEANDKPWEFNEEAGEVKPKRPRPKKSSNGSKNAHEENIPRVMQEEEKGKQEIPQVDPEAKKRIMDQLANMRERMNQRKGGAVE